MTDSAISATTNSGKGQDISLRNLENLQISNNSEISASTVNGKAGNLQINVDQNPVDTIALNQGIVTVKATGTGDAGNLNINTKQLNLDKNSVISASTNSGKGQDISLRNLENLQISNNSEISASTVNGKAGNLQINVDQNPVDTIALNQGIVTVKATGTGDAGNLNINSKNLTLDNNSVISASTNSGKGQDITLSGLNSLEVINSNISASTVDGQAGNVNINATNSVQFRGQTAISVAATDKGSAGNLTINTSQLNITDGATVSGSNVDGKGGNINITANTFTSSNGGQILTTTSGSAKAGNIIMEVKDNITLDGKRTGLFANTELGSTGDSGSIDIDPQIFIIKNGAGIGVNSQGSGKGGNIAIQAGTLTLDNNALINAATASNQGGEINLQVQDLLWLRHGSNITATAGTAGTRGNGGNITINAPFIIGFASENSNITANAFQGNGGNINITTNTIFGLKFQPQETKFSDITASSQFGLSGQVTINRLDVDLSKGLFALPSSLVDASSQLAQGCSGSGKLARQQNRFSIVGKGGLPSNPNDLLTGTTPLVDLVDVVYWQGNKSEKDIPPVVINNDSSKMKNLVIQQAQGWIISDDGRVILTAETPQVTLQGSGLNHPGCSVSVEESTTFHVQLPIPSY